jgi:deoxyribonuclease V
MIAIVDVHYRGDRARGACVVADRWTAAEPRDTRVVEVVVTEPYVPGSLFLREMPPILEVLRGISTDVIVVDAYVWLAPEKPGLGARVHDALSVPVVGVAKTPFRGAGGIEVLRGTSTRPLYVTAIGMDENEAAQHVRSMHGEHRIPTLLRMADALTRSVAR